MTVLKLLDFVLLGFELCEFLFLEILPSHFIRFIKLLCITNTIIRVLTGHFLFTKIVRSKGSFFGIRSLDDSLLVIHEVEFYGAINFGYDRLNGYAQYEIDDFERSEEYVSFNSELKDLPDGELNLSVFLFIFDCDFQIIFRGQGFGVVSTKQENDFFFHFFNQSWRQTAIIDS